MRILLIEDEKRIALSLKQGLEQERFSTDLAFDGESGLDLASEDNYDLLIIDWMLPKMDGLKICQNLRQEKITTPILLLTAKGQLHDKVAGLEAGADDYLTKPFAFEELLARIKALLRRPKSLTDQILQVADLTLNQNTFEVTRNQQSIALSQKEFALLTFLMRHQGQIVSKDQIINKVWDYEADILPNTVEAFIRNLRRKIDLPFKNSPPLIQTVRGFGYKLGK